MANNEKLAIGIKDEDNVLYRFIPPAASDSNVGGIKASPKTTQTQEVKIDPTTNRLYVDDPTDDIANVTGNLTNLHTTNKQNLVGAINEVNDAQTNIKEDLTDVFRTIGYAETKERAVEGEAFSTWLGIGGKVGDTFVIKPTGMQGIISQLLIDDENGNRLGTTYGGSVTVILASNTDKMHLYIGESSVVGSGEVIIESKRINGMHDKITNMESSITELPKLQDSIDGIENVIGYKVLKSNAIIGEPFSLWISGNYKKDDSITIETSGMQDVISQLLVDDENGNRLGVIYSGGSGKLTAPITVDTDRIHIYIGGTSVIGSGTILFSVNTANGIYTAVSEIKAKTNDVSSFRNNLITEGINPYISVYKDGELNNEAYGEDNVRYEIHPKSLDRTHIYFEWKMTENIPPRVGLNAVDMIPIFSAGGVSAGFWRRSAQCYNGKYAMRTFYGSGLGTAGQYAQISSDNYKPLNGKDAFAIRFTGDINNANNHDIIAVLTDSAITLKHSSGAVIYTLAVNSDTLISAIIDEINAFDDFEAINGEVGEHKYGELIIESYDIPLVYNFKYSDNTAYWDNPPVYIPYIKDDSWHTFEAIIDGANKKAYFAFDGYTVARDLYTLTLNDKKLVIGGVFNGTESKVKLRNLEVDIDNFGDAEIINSTTPYYVDDENNIPENRTMIQMISSHNSRLLIFEGHGIVNCKESDAPQGEPTSENGMATTTDRLEMLFEILKNSGYKPVTWTQVIEWKKNNVPIPKRSFCLMFDDFRVDNYVDYNKRKPFEKYGVKSGLAIISDGDGSTVPVGYDLDDTKITIHGQEYTVRQCMNMINRANWYPCSHSKSHTRLTSIKVSEIEEFFNDSLVSAVLHEVHPDILVYPAGDFDGRFVKPMEHSTFKLGVDIVKNWYNCRLCSDYRLVRVELATRQSWKKLIMPIV